MPARIAGIGNNENAAVGAGFMPARIAGIGNNENAAVGAGFMPARIACIVATTKTPP